jgi:glycine cleavage system H protein
MTVLMILATALFFMLLGYIAGRLKLPGKKTVSYDDRTPLKIYKGFMGLIYSGEFKMPNRLLYSRGHVWSEILPSGSLKVGVDDFPLTLIGEVDRIELNNPGDRINKKGRMCVLHVGNKKLSFTSPFEGKIETLNEKLLANPGLLSSAPYKEGWLYILKPAMNVEQFAGLKDSNAATVVWMQKEMEKLANFISHELPPEKEPDLTSEKKTYPVKGVLRKMDAFAWLKFQETFLS